MSTSIANFFNQLVSAIGSRVDFKGHHAHHSVGGNIWETPSTVDWCEKNYQVSDYIAEFFNTLSSMAMVLCGLIGVALHYKHFETRFITAFATVAIVGIGSVLFHGTLLFSLQMLDELPMIYSALTISYIMFEQQNLKANPYLPYILILHAVITTLLVASPVVAPQYASPLLQFVSFHISFLALQVFLIFRASKLYMSSKDENVRKMFANGIRLWLVGIGFWLVDYLGCDLLFEGHHSIRQKYLSFNVGGYDLTVPNPQLHSWWHICASSGLYLMSIFVAADRQQYLGKTVKIEWYMYVLPYVVNRSKATEGDSVESLKKKKISTKKVKKAE